MRRPRIPPLCERSERTFPARMPGELHGCAKLTARQVQRIRKLLALGKLSAPRIAALIGGGITQSAVYHIKNQASWCFLEWPKVRMRPSLTRKGENRPTAKLSDAKVMRVRVLLRRGETISWIARFYGVSRTVIRAVRDGKAWTHVGR